MESMMAQKKSKEVMEDFEEIGESNFGSKSEENKKNWKGFFIKAGITILIISLLLFIILK